MNTYIIKGVCWYTNLDYKARHENWHFGKKYTLEEVKSKEQ